MLRFDLFDLLAEHTVQLGLNEDEAALQTIVREYELALDAVITRELRYRRIDLPSSPIMKDHESRQHDARSLDYIDVMMEAVTAVATLLRDRGGAAGEAHATFWEEAFNARLCPELYRERWPDQLIEWLAGQPAHTAEQIAAAQATVDRYQQERRALRAGAIKAGIGARRLASRDPRPYAQAKVRLRERLAQTMVEFRSLLTPAQADQWERDVEGTRATQVRLFGPLLDTKELAALAAR